MVQKVRTKLEEEEDDSCKHTKFCMVLHYNTGNILYIQSNKSLLSSIKFDSILYSTAVASSNHVFMWKSFDRSGNNGKTSFRCTVRPI
jgi:hypothetical protein